MLKRILSAVGLLVAGFAMVVAVVCYQLNNMTGMIRVESTQRVPLYRETLAATHTLNTIGRSMADAFLARNESELQLAATSILHGFTNLNQSLQHLKGPKFKEFANLPTVPPPHSNPEQSVETKSQTREKGNMGQLIQNLDQEAASFRETADKALALAQKKYRLTRELSDARENLSKTFRKTLAAQALDSKAYNTLVRGVSAVLYTTSIRDLNFVGRAKFSEGLEGIRKVQNDAVKPVIDELEQQFNKTFELASSALTEGADYQFFEAQEDKISTRFATLLSTVESQFDHGQSALQTRAEKTSTLSLSVSITTIVIGTLVAFWIARATTRRLLQVTKQVNDGTIQVASASGELHESSHNLSDGATRQAAAVEETAAALSNISNLAKQNAENAEAAKNLTTQTSTMADQGADQVKSMHLAMAEIENASNDVGKIMKTINEIAFQTNILALNAAVEAARAGEAGLGFAVVADEVRNLAQRCSLAAQETAQKIEKSSHSSRQGVEITQLVTETLAHIVTKIREIDRLAGQIALASKEQNTGIGQIQQGMQEVEQIAQNNAAGSEESAAASSDLKHQSELLDQAVKDLEALIGGNNPDSRPRSSTSSSSPATSSPGSQAHSNPTALRHPPSPHKKSVPSHAMDF